MAEQTPNKPTNRRSGERRVGPRSAPGSAMWYVLGVMLLLALGQAFFSSMYSGKSVPYSEFKTLVRDGKVQELVVAEDRIRGTLKGSGRRPSAGVQHRPHRGSQAHRGSREVRRQVHGRGRQPLDRRSPQLGNSAHLPGGAVEFLLPAHGRRGRRRHVFRPQPGEDLRRR